MLAGWLVCVLFERVWLLFRISIDLFVRTYKPYLRLMSPRWNVNNGGCCCCCQTPAVNPDVDRGLELLSRRVPAEKAGRLQLPSPVASTALDGAKTRVALAGTYLIGPRIPIHLVTRRRKRQFVDGKRRMSPTQGNHARVCQQQGTWTFCPP
jgi:hypothetical protein